MLAYSDLFQVLAGLVGKRHRKSPELIISCIFYKNIATEIRNFKDKPSLRYVKNILNFVYLNFVNTNKDILLIRPYNILPFTNRPN